MRKKRYSEFATCSNCDLNLCHDTIQMVVWSGMKTIVIFLQFHDVFALKYLAPHAVFFERVFVAVRIYNGKDDPIEIMCNVLNVLIIRSQ